jgi:hypothetical protein
MRQACWIPEPETRDPECIPCAEHSHVIHTTCYGCVVRFLSRQPTSARSRYYGSLREARGEEAVGRVRVDVAAYREARRAAGAPRP